MQSHNRTPEEYEKIIANLKYELSNALQLNENLKRICKERANAKRNLRPKKQHDGFVVVSTGEARDRIKTRDGSQDIRVYKTVIETPFSIYTPADLLKEDGMEGICKYFDSVYEDSDANGIEKAFSKEYQDYNLVYRQEWRTGRNELWEIVCWHTLPFTMDIKEN